MTKVVINTTNTPFILSMASRTLLKLTQGEVAELPRHDPRLVALVEHFGPTTNTDLRIVEVPDDHKYRIETNGVGAECIVHECSIGHKWIDPAFDWDAAETHGPTITKLDMSSKYGNIGRKPVNPDVLVDINHVNDLRFVMQHIVDNTSDRSSAMVALGALAHTASQPDPEGAIDEPELCEDEGCDHYGTPHVCLNDNEIMRAALTSIAKNPSDTHEQCMHLAKDALDKLK